MDDKTGRYLFLWLTVLLAVIAPAFALLMMMVSAVPSMASGSDVDIVPVTAYFACGVASCLAGLYCNNKWYWYAKRLKLVSDGESRARASVDVNAGLEENEGWMK